MVSLYNKLYYFARKYYDNVNQNNKFSFGFYKNKTKNQRNKFENDVLLKV